MNPSSSSFTQTYEIGGRFWWIIVFREKKKKFLEIHKQTLYIKVINT